MAVGHAFPGWTQAGPIHLADLRVFVEDTDVVLDDTTIMAIAYER